jgi:plasmid stabilization system protein ParE
MSHHKYYLSPAAQQDINEIIDYLLKENISAVDRFVDTLFDAMNKLAQNPNIGHWRQDLTDKQVKFWTFKWHYLIIYRPIRPVEIIRILSGYRDIFNLIN